MAKVGSAFPGQWLKASDLQGRRIQVVIDHVKIEDVSGDMKPVAYFKGKDRGLALNKTNATSIWGLTGTDEMDNWGGTALTLYPSKTDYQGKRVDCIRIDPPDAVQRGAQQRQPQSPPPPPPVEQEAGELSDDDVPF